MVKDNREVKYYLFALGNSVVKVENGVLWYRRDRENHKWEQSNSWVARFYDAAYDVVGIELSMTKRQKQFYLNGRYFDFQ